MDPIVLAAPARNRASITKDVLKMRFFLLILSPDKISQPHQAVPATLP